jgi:hypothetical protein
MVKYLGLILFFVGLSLTLLSSYEAIHFYGLTSYARSVGIILISAGLVVALFAIGRKSS